MTKKNIVVAIVAFLMGCIVCSMTLTNTYEQEIEDLSNQLETANTRYEDMYHASEIICNDLYSMMESKYDGLIETADSMNDELTSAGLEAIEYDDRYFEDLFDEWANHIDPYMEFIIEKCNLE